MAIKLTDECRNNLLRFLEKELDTRDKRFMFLKLEFPNTVSNIELEGSASTASWSIYEEFEKQGTLGFLIITLNIKLGGDIKCCVVG